MKPDLLGYVLKTLDAQEQREVEEYLESNPSARQELLRMKPLLAAMDTLEASEPPDDLMYRTLRAVASQSTQDVAAKHATTKTITVGSTKLPKLEPWKVTEYEPSSSTWRKADAWALIAVVMLICLAIPPVIQYVRDRALQIECSNNLRQIHSAIHGYMVNHGSIPSLQFTGPASHAGVYAPILRDAGLWGEEMKLDCTSRQAAKPHELVELQKHNDDELAFWKNVGGTYAFHMGYLQNQAGKLQIQPVRLGDGDNIPILADRAPRCGECSSWTVANSPNHGGRGQYVLTLGGQVAFRKNRFALNGEDLDIFRNKNNLENVGLDCKDYVLGLSEARPVQPATPLSGD